MGSKVSLILATYGRKDEIGAFLESIVSGNYLLELIEVIIVDQNDQINLEPIIEKYKVKVKIIYIKSTIKGLSKNRNIGLDHASGDIIAFPDDDCEYLKDTLQIVTEKLMNHEVEMVLGKIIERDGQDSLRTWGKRESYVSKSNFYKKSSSITIFYKKESFDYKFDENLGVGEKFGACEDADFIYHKCKTSKKVLYTPEIKIYHPHYAAGKNMNEEKIQSYGLGFGAMVKKNCDINMCILFFKAEIFHLLKSLIHLIKMNKTQSLNSVIAFKSRIEGFLKYKNSEE
ncbi:MAG: glycosyltransferase family 2 protein [Sarcina sp.]